MLRFGGAAKIPFLCGMKWFGTFGKSLSQQWLFLWVLAWLGLVFSIEFFVSQAMIFMVAVAVFQREGWGLHFRRSFLRFFGRLSSEPIWWVVTLPFFIVLFSGFWTEDYTYWLERLRIKLPFLFLPLAFAAGPKLEEREWNLGLYLFLWVMFLGCLYVVVAYMADYEHILEGLQRGRTLPTPSNHIRFSLALSFSVFIAVWLAVEGFYWRWPWESKLLWALSAFFFLFLHFLAVRSGLLSLYVVLFVFLLRVVFSSRLSLRWRRLGWLALLLTLLMPFLSYRFVPAFQQRVKYMRWDWQQYLEGRTDFSSSDSDRLRSLEVGWSIGKEHLLLGVGAGDLPKEVKKRYEQRYAGKLQPKMPHSQWMSYFAGTGLLGLAVFLFSFFYPLFEGKRYRLFLFSSFFLIAFASLFVENTLETNFGVSFYVLFLLWLLSGYDRPFPP